MSRYGQHYALVDKVIYELTKRIFKKPMTIEELMDFNKKIESGTNLYAERLFKYNYNLYASAYREYSSFSISNIYRMFNVDPSNFIKLSKLTDAEDKIMSVEDVNILNSRIIEEAGNEWFLNILSKVPHGAFSFNSIRRSYSKGVYFYLTASRLFRYKNYGIIVHDNHFSLKRYPECKPINPDSYKIYVFEEGQYANDTTTLLPFKNSSKFNNKNVSDYITSKLMTHKCNYNSPSFYDDFNVVNFVEEFLSQWESDVNNIVNKGVDIKKLKRNCVTNYKNRQLLGYIDDRNNNARLMKVIGNNYKEVADKCDNVLIDIMGNELYNKYKATILLKSI